MSDTIRPVLSGQKALVVGVANDQSIAYGCAKAFRTAGADLAITWLNEKSRGYVEPLATELEASITRRWTFRSLANWSRCLRKSPPPGAGLISLFIPSPSRRNRIWRVAC